MSCFRETNDGNKEMIIFTIAKQFYQSTLASKSKNFKMLFWVCTFRNFENWNKSAHWRKRRTFFFGFNSHEFPLFTITVRRKKPQGASSLIHFFNKPSIVKQLFIETSAKLCHIYAIPCIRSIRWLVSHKPWPRMIFFEGQPSILPLFSLETWTVLETYLLSSTEIANIMQREHNRILRGSVIIWL